MREDEPQLLLCIGFDNLLDFSDCFRVALADVIEGAAWEPTSRHASTMVMPLFIGWMIWMAVLMQRLG